jgi:hypothetical protein
VNVDQSPTKYQQRRITKVVNKPNEIYIKFVKVNVSGCRFLIPVRATEIKSPSTAATPFTAATGLLHTFVHSNHEHRLSMCNGFFEHVQEYFFARLVS